MGGGQSWLTKLDCGNDGVCKTRLKSALDAIEAHCSRVALGNPSCREDEAVLREVARRNFFDESDIRRLYLLTQGHPLDSTTVEFRPESCGDNSECKKVFGNTLSGAKKKLPARDKANKEKLKLILSRDFQGPAAKLYRFFSHDKDGNRLYTWEEAGEQFSPRFIYPQSTPPPALAEEEAEAEKPPPTEPAEEPPEGPTPQPQPPIPEPSGRPITIGGFDPAMCKGNAECVSGLDFLKGELEAHCQDDKKGPDCIKTDAELGAFAAKNPIIEVLIRRLNATRDGTPWEKTETLFDIGTFDISNCRGDENCLAAYTDLHTEFAAFTQKPENADKDLWTFLVDERPDLIPRATHIQRFATGWSWAEATQPFDKKFLHPPSRTTKVARWFNTKIGQPFQQKVWQPFQKSKWALNLRLGGGTTIGNFIDRASCKNGNDCWGAIYGSGEPFDPSYGGATSLGRIFYLEANAGYNWYPAFWSKIPWLGRVSHWVGKVGFNYEHYSTENPDSSESSSIGSFRFIFGAGLVFRIHRWIDIGIGPNIEFGYTGLWSGDGIKVPYLDDDEANRTRGFTRDVGHGSFVLSGELFLRMKPRGGKYGIGLFFRLGRDIVPGNEQKMLNDDIKPAGPRIPHVFVSGLQVHYSPSGL